jgi:hypothetical protein
MTARDAEVKKAPASDAETVGTLIANTPVEITGRQGAWVAIRAEPVVGWTRMLGVRPIAAASEAEESGVRSLLNVARTGSSGAAVATGVRGLDRENMSSAAPNEAELAKLDEYRRDLGAAYGFAEVDPALAPQSIPYIETRGKSDAGKKKKK